MKLPVPSQHPSLEPGDPPALMETGPMQRDRIIDVTDETFESAVLGAEGPVVVDFWAPWCGPCRTFAASLDEVADELPDTLTVAKVNVDDNQALAQRFGVMSIPTLLFVDRGEVLGTFSGALPAHAIRDVFGRFVQERSRVA